MKNFKDGTIGEDMKASLLTMMNQIKKILYIPEVMKIANISTVPKEGSRFEEYSGLEINFKVSYL